MGPVDARTRRAFFGGLLHGAMLAVASALTSPSTVLPVFVKDLTGSTVAVGGVVGLMQLGAALVGVPAARYVEAAPLKKVFLYLAIAVRGLAFFILALLTYFYALSWPGVVFLTLAFFMVLFALAGGLGGVAYLPVIGKAIPPGLRGQFFGARSLLAGFLGAAAGWLSRPLWGRFPEGFALAFLLAALALFVGFWGFWLIPEPKEPRRPAPGFAQHLASVFALLQKPRLRRLLLVYVLIGFYFFALPFYAVAARAQGLPAEALGYLVAAQALAEGLNLWIGRWMDRFGPQIGIRIVALLALSMPLVALFGHGLWAAIFVFLLIGVITNGIENAFSAYLLACAPKAEAARHTALLYLASAPRALWPLLGGLLAARAGFVPLFGLTVLVLGVGLVLSLRLSDPAELE